MVLFLGTGESGKSTFMKQMQIIHGSGYTEEDKRKFASVVYQNIIMAMQSMIKAMDMLNIQYSDPSSSEHAELIKSVDFEVAKTYFESPYVVAVKALWADSGVQLCYGRRREYQLIDSAKYYFDEIDRIAMSDYVPTEQDILRSRTPTAGINDYFFSLDRRVFRIIDVGGQRSERRKWLHCFENVTTIIFLVALSEYDQCLYEAENQNRLRESNSLYTLLITSIWLKNIPDIIFFNKTDIFVEKIMESHLKDYFPEYEGPERNVNCAQTFIKTLFETTDPEREKKNYTYTHYTCATDTENIKVVFSAVNDIILKNILDRFTILT